MRSSFILFLLVTLLVITQLVSAQFPAESFALSGNGARAAGMGNAFTGVADDASAISWNPAGLTQLQSMEASIVGRLNFGSGSVDFPDDELILLYPYYSNDYDYGLGFMNNVSSWDVEMGSKFKVNFASFVFPFKLGQNNVVGGIAYRNLYDFSREVTNTINGELIEWNFYDDTFGTFGDKEYMSFSNVVGGVNAISPSIGFQVNDMFSLGATVNILTGSADFESYEEIDGEKFNEEDMTMDFSGTAIDLGVLVKPTPTFSIGANINLPHNITGEVDGEKGELEIPMFFNIGAGLRATDNLLLAFDYRSRPWSDAKDEDGDPLTEEDANSIHAGLEYLMMAGNSVMPVRLGFYTMPLPAQDAKEEQISNKVFTAGLGLIMGNIIIDGSFEWIMSTYAASTTRDEDPIDFNSNEFKVTVGAVIHFNQ